MTKLDFSDKGEYFSYYLTKFVPNKAKLALCFDPEGFLDDEEFFTDNNQRSFRILTYKENDLIFRLKFKDIQKKGWDSDNPILLRITLPDFCPNNHMISIISINDILQQVEGKAIDLRTDAVLTHLTEPVDWPEFSMNDLNYINEHLKPVVSAYWNLREKIGKKRPLAKFHISAVLLLSKYPELNYTELELRDAYPEDILFQYLNIAFKFKIEENDKGLLQRILIESSSLEKKNLGRISGWFDFLFNELAILFTLSNYFNKFKTPISLFTLSGFGFLSEDPKLINNDFSSIQKRICEDKSILSSLIDIADNELNKSQVELLIKDHIEIEEKWYDTLSEITPSIVGYILLKNYLSDYLNNKEKIIDVPPKIHELLEEVNIWDFPNMNSTIKDRFKFALRFINRVHEIQTQLKTSLGNVNQITDIVEIYPAKNEHLLEIWLDLARKDAIIFDDDNENLFNQINRFLDELKSQIVPRMEKIDHNIADIIRFNTIAYLNHPRSSIHFIKNYIPMMEKSEKVWILLFDGMRLDSWEIAIKPLLEKHFTIGEEKILLAPLPSYTQLARKSVFAGNYPNKWIGYFNRITGDEQILFAKNIGLKTDKDKDQEIIFIDHANTETGKRKLRNLKPKKYNCLVYNISDDDIHNQQGDLREINETIQNKIEKDIIDQILRLTKPNDLILILSDHGFIELDKEKDIEQPRNIDDNQVMYRYLNDAEDSNGISVPYSGKKYVNKVTCIIGRSWYYRRKNKRFSRYSHGGISLHELLIPGVVLEKIQPIEELNIDFKVPPIITGIEDEELEIPISIKNKSKKKVKVRLFLENKLISTKEIKSGEKFEHSEVIHASLDIRILQVSIKIILPDGKLLPLKGSKRNIQLKIKKRVDKVEFRTGLDKFD